MKKIFAFLLATVLIFNILTFRVEESRLAVLTFFGKASQRTYTPGLYFRFPWPLSKVSLLDGRIQAYRGMEEQVLSEDQNSFRIRSFALWRILPGQVNRFWEKVGSMERFESEHFSGLLLSHQNALMGQMNMSELFSEDKYGGLFKLEESLKTRLNEVCQKEYGVEVLRVGLSSLGLTDSVLNEVYAKMSSERNRISAQLRAEGQAQSAKIRAEAKSRYDSALARANADAKAMIGKAEADSIESYKILAADPELSLKLKKIETLESLLRDRSTVILDPSVSPLDILFSTER